MARITNYHRNAFDGMDISKPGIYGGFEESGYKVLIEIGDSLKNNQAI